MEAYIRHIWERRAIAQLWRLTAQTAFDERPCRVNFLDLRDAICQHEKESAIYDVLTVTRPFGKGKIAPMPRGRG